MRLMKSWQCSNTHKALYEKGILHCDTNAGKVILTDSLEAGSRRFLTDLEFAQFQNSINGALVIHLSKDVAYSDAFTSNSIEGNNTICGPRYLMTKKNLRPKEKASSTSRDEISEVVENFMSDALAALFREFQVIVPCDLEP
ncbi:hypothetical protein BDN70DRAFT_898916 [Pholiota conissans]|uniref:Uncharacterized protein n=1 Tax=Pholiota conissans TaxID=109636 RepID=A0A9P5YTL8_9AGAR|nr:hypothetical protein BDN70DRAFT_898916 [Pholiota conissans]